MENNHQELQRRNVRLNEYFNRILILKCLDSSNKGSLGEKEVINEIFELKFLF